VGETSADTQREIESLRDDVAGTIEELERRARSIVDLKKQAEEHPAAVGVVGFGLLAGVSVMAYNALTGYRERRKPVNRLKRRASEVTEELGERWSRTRESMPVVVRNRREDESVDSARGEPGMLKKLLWMGLSAGMIALAGLLARRLTTALWERVMGEPPPTAKV
jgi:hypothetical protein